MEKSNYLHGTNFKFDIGQVILPAKKAGVESNYDEFLDVPGRGRVPLLEGLSEHAFATADEQEALKAADKAVGRKGAGEARVYRVSPVDVEDIDFDPNSSSQSGIRSRSGFKVEEEIATNNIRNLRFDIDGKAYFLHYSKADLKVGQSILPSGSSGLHQTNTGDALFGRSYGYDALDPRSIQSAMLGQAPGVLANEGTPEQTYMRRLYLTSAPIENVGADINIMKAEYEGGGLERLGRHNYRAVLGEQEILDRVEIPFDNTNETNIQKSTTLIEDLLKRHGITQNTKEDQRLVNIAHTISSRTVQDTLEYNDMRIKTRINDFISKDYLNKPYIAGKIEEFPSMNPFVEAVKEKDLEKAFNLRHLAGEVFPEISGEQLLEPEKVQAVISVYEDFETSTGSKIGKKLPEYGKAEMAEASRTISRKTLGGILEAGEVAAKVMRFRF
jgi:hypothetical protein